MKKTRKYKRYEEHMEKENKILCDGIEITPGSHKYIFVEGDEQRVISKDKKWHKEIYETISDDVPEISVNGGGFISFDPDTLEIIVSGSSGSYGKADHDKVKAILEEKLGNGYTVISETDIQREKQLEADKKKENFRQEFDEGIEEIVKKMPKHNRTRFYKKLDMIELMPKDDLIDDLRVNYLTHINCNDIKDLDNFMSIIERSELYRHEYGKELLREIPLNLRDYSISADKVEEIADNFLGSKYLTEEDIFSFKQNMAFRVVEHTKDYDKLKEFIKYAADCRFDKEILEKKIYSRIRNFVLKTDNPRERYKDLKVFLEENDLDSNIITECAKGYLLQKFNPNSNIVEFKVRSYFERFAEMAEAIELPKEFVKKTMLDEIRRYARLDIRHTSDKTSYTKIIAEAFDIPAEEYLPIIAENLDQFELENLTKEIPQAKKAVEEYCCRKLEELCGDKKNMAKAFIGYMNLRNLGYMDFMSDDNARKYAQLITEERGDTFIEQTDLGQRLDDKLKKRGLDDIVVYTGQEKEEAFDRIIQEKRHDYGKKAFEFAYKHDLDEGRKKEAARAYFRETISDRSISWHLLERIKKKGVDLRELQDEARAEYIKRAESIKERADDEGEFRAYGGQFIHTSLHDTLKMAKETGLSIEGLKETARAAVEGFISIGSLDYAQDIAGLAELPEKESIDKIMEVY